MVGDPGSSEQCKIDGNRLRHFWTRGCAAYRAFSAATGQASPYRSDAIRRCLPISRYIPARRSRGTGWSDWSGQVPEESGRANLRQALSSIRKALGPEAGELIVASRDRVAIRRDGLATDLQSLQSAATAPDVAHPLPSENIFLEGLAGFSPEFDTWRAAEQARVWDLLRECLANRVEPALAERRFGDAAMLLARALEIEPLDEAANRGLMRLHLAQGRSGEALRQFDRLRSLLEVELGESPEQETLDLAKAIRARRRAPPPPSGSPVSGAHEVHNQPGMTASLAPVAGGTHLPVTCYARSGQRSVAYQVSGHGPIDLIYVQGWVSNIDFAWTHPALAKMFDRLGAFARLIRFDKRGTGLSDRDVGLPTLEERMEDLTAVMDAAGSRRAVLLGTSEGGNLCMLFAAAHPERAAALVLFGAYAKGLWSADYPWAKTEPQLKLELAAIARDRPAPSIWPKARRVLPVTRPSGTGSPPIAAPRQARTMLSGSGGGAPRSTSGPCWAIGVPTLVLHRTGDRWVHIEEGRFLAERIAGAQIVEFPGEDHLLWAGDNDRIIREIERLVASLPGLPAPERVLTTILAARLDGLVATQSETRDDCRFDPQHDVVRYGGTCIDATGRGVLARFDRPSAAIACAMALRDRCRAQGLPCRVGIHTGECERDGAIWAGPALQIAGQLARRARQSEILVSQTVRDIVVGTEIVLQGCGEAQFADIAGRCRSTPFAPEAPINLAAFILPAAIDPLLVIEFVAYGVAILLLQLSEEVLTRVRIGEHGRFPTPGPGSPCYCC